MYNETTPNSLFDVHGISYRYRYYLVNEIYPECSCFVKSLSCPNDRKMLKFQAQEKERKAVERAFDALKKCWHILKYPEIFVDEEKMDEVMYICIILRNMILKDEGSAICEFNENEIVPPTQTFAVGSDKYLMRRSINNDIEAHHLLRRDLT
ncbi:uncharacterized protein LOC111885431 [Lactuca sativa]|uniref:uncharacterized protein LOC111885431 n=1 Tax=Lactuca sativa TaxID=4236 RepID=UPI000CD85A5F|nr:uncharacterized protein LOC111885431 [Lactuca sativa]